MERGSNLHSARMDDALKGETELLVRGSRGTHAEEWKSPEPSGEDQPDVDRVPDGTLAGGVPAGMSEEDVAGRSELATYLDRSAFPALGTVLVDNAVQHEAPDRVVQMLRRLPSGREFQNVGEVWTELGGGHEEARA